MLENIAQEVFRFGEFAAFRAQNPEINLRNAVVWIEGDYFPVGAFGILSVAPLPIDVGKRGMPLGGGRIELNGVAPENFGLLQIAASRHEQGKGVVRVRAGGGTSES